jgi:hypothetical protein
MKNQTNNRMGVRSSIEADGMNRARNVTATRSLKVRSGLKAGYYVDDPEAPGGKVNITCHW